MLIYNKYGLHFYIFCLLQALKAIKTAEFMPYIVFIAAPPIEIMRNMHEYARQRGRTNKMKSVSSHYD